MSTKLSTNFTLEELIATSSHLSNIPTEQQVQSLKLLTIKVLQPARDLFKDSIDINSGFRSLTVNKDVGGVNRPLSQHCKGEAADIDCSNNGLLFKLIREHLVFDQMIWERGNDINPSWVHVSYKATGNRNQCLRMIIVGGKKQYVII